MKNDRSKPKSTSGSVLKTTPHKKKRKFIPLIGKDGEVRELKKEDIALMKPMVEVMPDLVEAYKKTLGRPHKVNKAVPKSIRLAADVAKHFEAMGSGWQTRMNEVLRELIQSHKI